MRAGEEDPMLDELTERHRRLIEGLQKLGDYL
jgi:hypothetical protein